MKSFAARLREDTNGKFIGLVTDAVDEESGDVTFSLYISVPELKDYMYKLIEAKIQDWVTPYPAELTLFAKAPKNNRTFLVNNATEYQAKLTELITSSVTRAILMHLKTLVEIRQQYTL
jgi:hypothetical protein